MILKKLRQQHHYSQEQLATMSGVSIRTIQRIESSSKGKSRASLETLKSIAAVFDISIEELTKEIVMIDKQTENWKSVPFWIRAHYLGLRTRKSVDWFEKGCAILGFIGLFIGIIVGFNDILTLAYPALLSSSSMFAASYAYRLMLRYGDEKQIW